MSFEKQQLKNILEAALLASGQVLSIDRMLSLFVDELQPDRNEICEALDEIALECETRGIELKLVSSGYRFQAKQDYSTWVSRLWEERPPRYSRALLETLVLIAYRQPITRGEIEDVRGVSVSSHIIKTLQEREWVRVVGHRDVPGKPGLYATTKEFLDYFNLKSLQELPTLSEIRDLDKINPELEFMDPGLAEAQARDDALLGKDYSEEASNESDGSETDSNETASNETESGEALSADIQNSETDDDETENDAADFIEANSDAGQDDADDATAMSTGDETDSIAEQNEIGDDAETGESETESHAANRFEADSTETGNIETGNIETGSFEDNGRETENAIAENTGAADLTQANRSNDDDADAENDESSTATKSDTAQAEDKLYASAEESSFSGAIEEPEEPAEAFGESPDNITPVST